MELGADMSCSISTLLIRNLQDVFGENHAARRRAAIDELYTEDGVFYDPTSGAHRGRDEIDRVAGAMPQMIGATARSPAQSTCLRLASRASLRAPRRSSGTRRSARVGLWTTGVG